MKHAHFSLLKTQLYHQFRFFISLHEIFKPELHIILKQAMFPLNTLNINIHTTLKLKQINPTISFPHFRHICDVSIFTVNVHGATSLQRKHPDEIKCAFAEVSYDNYLLATWVSLICRNEDKFLEKNEISV